MGKRAGRYISRNPIWKAMGGYDHPWWSQNWIYLCWPEKRSATERCFSIGWLVERWLCPVYREFMWMGVALKGTQMDVRDCHVLVPHPRNTVVQRNTSTNLPTLSRDCISWSFGTKENKPAPCSANYTQAFLNFPIAPFYSLCSLPRAMPGAIIILPLQGKDYHVFVPRPRNTVIQRNSLRNFPNNHDFARSAATKQTPHSNHHCYKVTFPSPNKGRWLPQADGRVKKGSS